mgnify:CR=1 FL=1
MQFATDIAAYTCICCPLGCRIEVALDENGQVSEVCRLYLQARGPTTRRRRPSPPSAW